MKTDKTLQERRADELDKADAIVALAEKEERALTTEEAKEVEERIAEAARLAEEIEANHQAKVLREQIDAAKRYTVPEVMRQVSEDDPAPEKGTPITVTEHESRRYQKGDALGSLVAARLRFGPWDQQRAINEMRKAYGERSPQVRALQASTFTAGGAFIPENFVGSEFIELLRPVARVRGSGVRTVTLTNGSWTTPKMTGGATSGFFDEGGNITASQPTTGQVKLVAKKQGILVPFSNELRRFSSLETERIIRDDMVRAAANGEDVAFLKGNGLNAQPKGIYNWIPASQRSASAGTSLANVRTDIRTMKNGLNSQNAPSVRRVFQVNSRIAEYMGWDLVDGNGNFAFPSMQQDEGMTLAGATAYRNNNISITLGGGTDSEIYYYEASECIIGDALGLEIEIIDNATYVDSAGNTRSGVSRDESVIRLIRYTDFGMRHTESAYVLETVQYGA